MASKELAVEGMTFKFVNPAHSGNVVINDPPSSKNKCIGNGIYKDNLSINITNGSDGSITNGTGAGNIAATGSKVKIDNNILVLRKGDQSGNITITGTNPSPPPPTLQYTTQVEIDDPGQTKVKGE